MKTEQIIDYTYIDYTLQNSLMKTEQMQMREQFDDMNKLCASYLITRPCVGLMTSVYTGCHKCVISPDQIKPKMDYFNKMI